MVAKRIAAPVVVSLLLGAAWLPSAVDAASACSCYTNDHDWLAERADRVFEGRAVWSVEVFAGRMTVFEVDRVLKGEPKLDAHIWSDPGSTCSVDFEVGQSYRVYSSSAAEGSFESWPSPVSYTGICDGTGFSSPTRFKSGVPVEPIRTLLSASGLG